MNSTDSSKAPLIAIDPVDNFYQTSSFFPMPVVAVATLNEEGETNIGPYSLCFPYLSLIHI